MNHTKIGACLVPALLLATVAAVAGPLDPPAGPIGGTGKTTQEVYDKVAQGQSRTPLSAATTPGDSDSMFAVSQSGSYYLTADLYVAVGKSGIKINNGAATNVTIDLNGFTIHGGNATLDGVRTTLVAGGTSLRIYNGTIISMGGNGLNVYGQTLDLSQVAAEFCGQDGLAFSGSAITVKDCRAFWNTGDGFHSTSAVHMNDCAAELNTANGIEVASGIVSRCNIASGSGRGIMGNFALHVTDCQVNCSGDGITVANSSTVARNSVSVPSTRVAVHATGQGNRIEENNVHGASIGIQVDTSSGNVVVKNSSHASTTAFSVPAGNFLGPVISSAAGVGAASPWANFSF